MSHHPTRKLTVFALDPSVKSRGKILRTQIEILNEYLGAGPRGHRVFVVDYDSSTDRFRTPAQLPKPVEGQPPEDPFASLSDRELLASPDFHAFMCFAIVMKTLARFEFALGRRLSWSFPSHQLQVAPHAFSDANAFYSDSANGLFFGYFPSKDGKRIVHTCLSHEIVAHETTHALLDGLRERYTDASSAQQAGFHEGFADIVALLSILSAQSIVEKVVDLGLPGAADGTLRRASVTVDALKMSGLFGLAQEMGSELAGVHGNALRRSVGLPPNKDYLTSADCDEPHRCGEVLVAAVLNAYLGIWVKRLQALGDESRLDRSRAAEEGAQLAEHLLNVCIRAIDYCPPQTSSSVISPVRCLLLTPSSIRAMPATSCAPACWPRRISSKTRRNSSRKPHKKKRTSVIASRPATSARWVRPKPPLCSKPRPGPTQKPHTKKSCSSGPSPVFRFTAWR